MSGVTDSPAQIDATVEQVVRYAADPVALDASVRELAGLLGYELVVKAPVVHRYFGGHWDGDAYIAACGQLDGTHHDHMGADVNCPGCLKTWECTDHGWWTHDTTAPADGHDAVLGGPA